MLGWTITLALVVVGVVWLGAGQGPCELPSRMIDGLTAECHLLRRQAALVLGTAVLAAHIVVLAAIVVTAWLASQPPPRHRKELLLRRRAWSGLAVAVALVGLFLWSVAAQRGVIVG